VTAIGIDIRIGARDHGHIVCAIGEGDPALVAGDDPFVAVEHGPCLDSADVGPSLGLRHRHAAEIVSARGTLVQLAPMLVAHMARAGHVVSLPDDRCNAHPGTRQLFRHQAIFEAAKTEAAQVLRDEHAEIAHVGKLAAQLHGNIALHRIELIGDRQHFLHGEVARGVLDQATLVRHISCRNSGYWRIHAAVLNWSESTEPAMIFWSHGR
jgi:hypothetical protein